MSILKNAVDSIEIGLEDYESSDSRRLISCTRNIFAGILLLFKHKLSELSPTDSDEVLIKKTILPSMDSQNTLSWKGNGTKTVDVSNIQERFGALKIKVNWAKLNKINTFRNEIEHYYSEETDDAVRSLISDSFIIINEFVRNHLNLDPKDLLGEKSWLILTQVNKDYSDRKAKCDEVLEKLNYYTEVILDAFKEYSCGQCGSGLIKPTNKKGNAYRSEFVCESCAYKLPYEEFTNLAVESYFEADNYMSYKDGDESSTTECPGCCDGVYVMAEGVCATCGYTAEHECQRCFQGIMASELDTEPYCGWCAHMIEKVMNE